MPTIAELSQRHPSCDPVHVERLRALYSGGKLFQKCMPKLLLQRPFETDQRYQLRKNEAHYRNYIGPIVDYFTSMLFAARPRIVAKKEDEVVPDPGEFYGEFQEDADRNGSDIDAVFKDRLTEAMVSRCAWLRIHEPSDDGAPAGTAAEFDDRGLGNCWLERLDYDSVLDWESDESGRLEWVVLHKQTAKRNGLNASRDTITETWEHVTAIDSTVYEITYQRNSRPHETQEVLPKGTTPHRFGSVPLVPLELPEGLWVANRLETPQIAHFRLSNAQTWGMATACYAMAVFKVDNDAEGNFRMPTMGAGYGVIMGKEDDVTWLAPPTAPFDALGEEIKAQKDEIFRIAHQMGLGVENNAAAVGRSAESKVADLAATRVVLLAYSRIVKEAIEYCYELISAQRGDEYTWSVEGLDDFAAVDVQGLADVLTAVKGIGGIPSKTWNAAALERLAEAILPDMDQALKQKVREEIQANTPEPGEEAEKQIEQLNQQLKMKFPPGAQPPNGKPPGKQAPPPA